MTDNVKNKKYYHVEKFWDSLNKEVQDQIMHELKYDPSILHNQSNSFENLPSMLKRIHLIKYFDDFENSESETFKGIRWQMENPNDMTETGKWYDRLDEVEISNILDLSWSHTEWKDVDDDMKWVVHKKRMRKMKIRISKTKILSLNQSSACVSREKERQLKTERAKAMKNVKVTCWHCGNTDQKIQSQTEPFKCNSCNEDLWTGDGGFLEIKVGVWR